ncbi:hypothetical protein JTE90_016879 [Oedothorax gibbosus]|uniref:Uncharacterized protein n=1 Tax=Oedothorax gibbosus TaxID=931172 RepID=A0AAV6UAW5_9ARAC|nr:hypothetical protein JTE90_016879 [Oedothorax gibbosus]
MKGKGGRVPIVPMPHYRPFPCRPLGRTRLADYGEFITKGQYRNRPDTKRLLQDGIGTFEKFIFNQLNGADTAAISHHLKSRFKRGHSFEFLLAPRIFLSPPPPQSPDDFWEENG